MNSTTRRRSGTVHFNARMPKDLSVRLRRFAEGRRVSTSAAAMQLLDEALRMELFPGISFRWTSIGRQPVVTGTGMTVWEVYHIYLDHKRDVRRMRKGYSHLHAAQIQAAAAYALAFPGEEPAGLWDSRPEGVMTVRV